MTLSRYHKVSSRYEGTKVISRIWDLDQINNAVVRFGLYIENRWMSLTQKVKKCPSF